MLYLFYDTTGTSSNLICIKYINSNIDRTIRPTTILTHLQKALDELYELKPNDIVKNGEMQFDEENDNNHIIEISLSIPVNIDTLNNYNEKELIEICNNIIRQELNIIDRNWEFNYGIVKHRQSSEKSTIKYNMKNLLDSINNSKQNYTNLDIKDVVQEIYNEKDDKYKYIFGSCGKDIYIKDNNCIVGRFFGGIANWDFGGDGSWYENASEEELETLRQDYSDVDNTTEKGDDIINKFIMMIKYKYNIIPHWTNYKEKGWSEFYFDKDNKYIAVYLNTSICSAIKNNFLILPNYAQYGNIKTEVQITRSDTEIKSIINNCIKYKQATEKQFKYIIFALKVLLSRIDNNEYNYN